MLVDPDMSNGAKRSKRPGLNVGGSPTFDKIIIIEDSEDDTGGSGSNPIKSETPESVSTLNCHVSRSRLTVIPDNLHIFLQNVDGVLDWKIQYPAGILDDTSASEFFEFYAAKSGVSSSDLRTLTFEAAFDSAAAPMTIERDLAEWAWMDLKYTLRDLASRADKTRPVLKVWIKHIYGKNTR